MKIAYTTPLETVSAPRAGDAGYDLHAAAGAIVRPGTRECISIGVILELPPGTVGLIRDRSGLARFDGVHVMGGVLDNSYRGIVSVILRNTSDKPFEVETGDRIAQMLILPVLTPALEIVAGVWEMERSTRGEQGFGSTGRAGALDAVLATNG